MIRAVIFDLDGVLVDAAEWHYLALNRALKLFSYSLSDDSHQALYNGLPTAAKLDLLSLLSPFPRGLAPFVNHMKQVYTQETLRAHCRPNAKITDLLQHLETEGYCIALGSNSQRNTIRSVLRKMEIENFFDVVVSQEDVNRPKPCPDVYQECVKKLGVRPEECLIVEDSRPGIQAAKAVSPHVLVAPNPGIVEWSWVHNKLKRLEEQTTALPELEIIIPMAGLGSRFTDAGYASPKPFIDVHGRPMIQWVIENLKTQQCQTHFTFLVNAAHLKSYPVENQLRQLVPGCSIVGVPGTTEGAACTVMLAMDQVTPGRPLLIANSDQWIDSPIDGFLGHALTSGTDGLIMTFPATDKKWSYAKTDAHLRVLEVAEKSPISPHATVGIYYFKKAEDFFEAAQKMITKDIRTNNEFYVCPVYNQMVEAGKDVRIFAIKPDKMHGLGTPADLERFLARSI